MDPELVRIKKNEVMKSVADFDITFHLLLTIRKGYVYGYFVIMKRKVPKYKMPFFIFDSHKHSLVIRVIIVKMNE